MSSPGRKIARLGRSVEVRPGIIYCLGNIADNPKFQTTRVQDENNRRDKDEAKDREKNFEKRKELACFECGKVRHYRYACTELITNHEMIGRLNRLENINDLGEAFKPSLGKGKVNIIVL